MYASEEESPDWSKRATRVLQTARAKHSFVQANQTVMLPSKDTVEWWTFAGGAANAILARVLEEPLGGRVSFDNLKLTFREGAATSEPRIRDAMRELHGAGRPSLDDGTKLYRPGSTSRLSKFARCLPEALQQEGGARDAFDIPGARATLAEPCINADMGMPVP
jgi:ATP-dependent Lhr-like helicase